MQTFRMVHPPPGFPPKPNGPHGAALMFAKDEFQELNCAKEKLPQPTCSGIKYPSMEQVLCSLVHRADHPSAPAVNGTCEDLEHSKPTLPQRVVDVVERGWNRLTYLGRRLRQLRRGRDEL